MQDQINARAKEHIRESLRLNMDDEKAKAMLAQFDAYVLDQVSEPSSDEEAGGSRRPAPKIRPLGASFTGKRPTHTNTNLQPIAEDKVGLSTDSRVSKGTS